MDESKPSLARRALAVLVLVVVAVVAFKIVLGAIYAVFWIAAVVAAIVAGLWAWSILRSGRRERPKKRERSVKPASAAPLPPADRVEAEMLKLKQQLRDQGRL
jgi:ABC-type nickel/cobalt efflux system permease component RcnA